MIERKMYLDQLIKARCNGFPKVITGIRRCGKSYLLKEIYKKYLLEQGVLKENILILELDDDKNAHLRDPMELGKYIRTYCKKGNETYYVFLDEIQRVYTIVNPMLTENVHILAKEEDKEVVSFVDVVLGLSHEENIDLYVTGSNSKMLSKDIVTEFRDKATNIEMHPLSFDEFYHYVKGSKIEALYEYLQYGGMPLAVLKSSEDKKEYLKRLFETTYFKDILEHHHLKKSESLDELCNIISSCTGDFLNAEKIANTYQSVTHEKIDKDTIVSYLTYFMDAFLLREAKRFDVKGRNVIGAKRKYYFTDTGLRNARLNFAYEDEGQMLENVIYNELIYNGYSVNVGVFDSFEKDQNSKTIRKSNEIDFYAKKGNRHYYIQVSSDIQNAKTRAREMRPFSLLRDQVQRVLVILRPIEETRDEKGNIIIGAVDFMLRFIK